MRVRPQYVLTGVAALITALLLYAVAIRQPDQAPPYAGNEAGLAPPISESMAKAPSIELETNTLTVGTIPRDRNMEYHVRIFNRGGSTLEISDIRTSCPCTVGIMDPAARHIAPGTGSQMLVQIIPSRIFGFHSLKTLTIASNDPIRPHLTLTVEASVDPEFVLEPDAFDFGQVEKGETPTASMRLRQLADIPVELQRVALSLEEDEQEEWPFFTFDWKPVPESEWQQPGKKEFHITAVLAPHCPAGTFERPVFLFSGLERVPYYRVLARGTVNSFYTVEVLTSGGRPAVNPDSPLRIIIDADRPIDITDLEAGHPPLQMTAKQESGHRWTLAGVLMPDLPPGLKKTTLSFMVESEGRKYPERMVVWLFPRVS